MGKYDKIVKTLPGLPEDVKYQEKIDKAKESILTRNASALARTYAKWRVSKKEVEDQLKVINVTITACEQLMKDAFENEDLSSIKLATGETVRMQPEPYAQVEDRDVFRQWCLDSQLERSLMLPWMTTNSLLKERLINGQEEMPGVKAWVRTSFVFRKK